ncbi:hypothetical protein [Staphylococcus warneri]|uniref:hypothetical protein n=1 Tax=Staphylococcus warneri TaxID=1292 RepID=UPI001038FB50|nr:hypothetical protein [Staphylococcus warneri]TBW80215.1 hypothetical protein EQ810_08405 [Staphylococcus warneri]
MTLLWIGLLIVVAVVNKVIVNRLLQKRAQVFARIVATVTTICAIILVYLLIKSVMPFVIERMNVFYHH